VDESIVSVGLLVGLAFGFVAGMGFAVCRRAWSDYKKVKAGLPGMRSTAWTLTGAAFSKGGLAIAFVVAVVAYAYFGQE
jgi:hypothetical protein